MKDRIPGSWGAILADKLASSPMQELDAFLAGEIAAGKEIYPEADRVFAALAATPIEEVRAVIIGQDPYHGGQAHGLCFSVRKGVRKPPSLRNIFLEMKDDLGFDEPEHGCLEDWARQGVLMLNSVLTVERGKPASHAGRGWETFTDDIIRAVNDRCEGVVFILWGAYAQKKASFVDEERHLVIRSPHPSPFAARSGFFGSKPFSRANDWLRARGKPEIDWRIA